MAHVVFTFTGRDQPGVVHRLASVVREHGGNWEEGRMARLAGRFAGILDVTLADDRVAALTAALEALDADGVRVLVDPGVDAPEFVGRRVQVDATGTDRPGIVRDVSAALARLGVNIVDLHTTSREAPVAGGLLFVARALVDVPEAVSVDAVRAALEALADDLLVEVAEAP
jgi:glycine cleavage system regulatory protein